MTSMAPWIGGRRSGLQNEGAGTCRTERLRVEEAATLGRQIPRRAAPHLPRPALAAHPDCLGRAR